MKRTILAALFVGIAALAAWAQPKVAVLDAIIPQNMDPSVIIPVTEKIVEKLVVSGRFTVLDRANIESVLKEREFQLSGLVSDQDVVTAGKYLGADFVVVAKVTKVSDTYFISAKMIAIKTGVIANQTSAQGEGKLSTLITIAEQVGAVLSGGAASAQAAIGAQQEPPVPETKAEAKKSDAASSSDPLRRRIAVSAGVNSTTITNSGSISGTGSAFDIHVLYPVFRGVSAVASLDIVSFETSSGIYLWENSYVDFMVGGGYAWKKGPFVLFADIKGGLTSGTESGSYDWSGAGACIGFDVGCDYGIGSKFLVGARYQYVNAAIAVEDIDGTTVGMSSFLLSAGIRL